MMTLGDMKDLMATATVNQALRAQNSILGKIVHWVVTDIINTADFWWNQDTDTFVTVASTADYFLNNRVNLDKISIMVNETNNNPIIKKPLTFFYDIDPTPTETGSPGFFAYIGQEECIALPTDAGVVTVNSSSANDTSEVIFKGKSNGIETYDVVNLNGTSDVIGSVSFDASLPINVNLETACSGLVTATRGVTIAQIPKKHLRVQRTRIKLGPVPDAADTFRYWFYKRSLPLVNDSDLVDLPDVAFKALRSGVEEVCHFLTGKSQASALAFKKYEEDIRKLVSVSERDVAGNEIKDYKEKIPFSARLPESIDFTVSA